MKWEEFGAAVKKEIRDANSLKTERVCECKSRAVSPAEKYKALFLSMWNRGASRKEYEAVLDEMRCKLKRMHEEMCDLDTAYTYIRDFYEFAAE